MSMRRETQNFSDSIRHAITDTIKNCGTCCSRCDSGQEFELTARRLEIPSMFSSFLETEHCELTDGRRYPLADNRVPMSENNSVCSLQFQFRSSEIGYRPTGIGDRQFRFLG